MQHKQEECAREIRYLNHQLAMTKGNRTTCLFCKCEIIILKKLDYPPFLDIDNMLVHCSELMVNSQEWIWY